VADPDEAVNPNILRRLQQQVRLLQEQNLALNERLDAVDELCGEWTGTDVPPAFCELGERLSQVLSKHCAPSLPYPDAVHAAFHWRDPRRPDGLFDALCGDGFGFLYATEEKLGVQFDCAGVHACADIPYEKLGEVLNKAGMTLRRSEYWRMQEEAGRDFKAEDEAKHAGYVEKVEKLATVQARRVLDAALKLPLGALAFLSRQLGPGRTLTPAESEALDHFVALEIDRRISDIGAEVGLERHLDLARVIETPHADLLEELERFMSSHPTCGLHEPDPDFGEVCVRCGAPIPKEDKRDGPL